jgi:hypothetical protein
MVSEDLRAHLHRHHVALGCKMGNVSIDGVLLNERHRGGVSQLQFSRIDDGKLMSLGEDGIVRVHDWKNRISILTIDSGSGRPLGKIIASTFSSCFVTHIHIATDAQCLVSLNMEKQARDGKVLLSDFSEEIPSNAGMKTRSSGSATSGRKRSSTRSKQMMITTLGGRSLLPLSSTGSQSKEDARLGIRWLLRHKVRNLQDDDDDDDDVEGTEISAENILDPPSDVLMLSSDRSDAVRLLRMEQSRHIDNGHLDESAFLYACEGRMKSMISKVPRVTPMMLVLSMTSGVDCFLMACTRMLQQAIQDQNVQMECCMLMILGKHTALSSRLGESGFHRESILLSKLCGNSSADVEQTQTQTSLHALEEEMLGKGLSEQACKISLALGDYLRAVRILAAKPEPENIALMFEIMEKSGCIDGETASLISMDEAYGSFGDNVDGLLKMKREFQGLRVQHILSKMQKKSRSGCIPGHMDFTESALTHEDGDHQNEDMRVVEEEWMSLIVMNSFHGYQKVGFDDAFSASWGRFVGFVQKEGVFLLQQSMDDDDDKKKKLFVHSSWTKEMGIEAKMAVSMLFGLFPRKELANQWMETCSKESFVAERFKKCIVGNDQIGDIDS